MNNKTDKNTNNHVVTLLLLFVKRKFNYDNIWPKDTS